MTEAHCFTFGSELLHRGREATLADAASYDTLRMTNGQKQGNRWSPTWVGPGCIRKLPLQPAARTWYLTPSVPTTKMRGWPGTPYPLGATWDGVGVNFAVFSEHATRVELCLFDSPEAEVESV